jgi:cytochrome c biogenesis protein CcmG, thiol:disulfide interchange protein DsbE
VRIAGALRRLPARRKIGIGVAAVCLVVIALVSIIGSADGSTRSAAHAPTPAARGFALHVLGRPGAEVSLSQYRGRALVVNFFASWCVPCKAETPLLARFYRAHHGQVTIVGIDVNDSQSAALAFVRKAGVAYPVGTDPDGATATSYGVVAIPQTFFLNAGHHIVKRVFGAVTLAELDAGLARMR